MNAIINTKSEAIAELCHRHGVRQLGMFEPAVAGTDLCGFSRGSRSCEVGFLFEFEQDSKGFKQIGRMMALQEDLQKLVQREVAVVQHHIIENNPSQYHRQAILSHLEPVYG